jgi:protein SCO1
MFTTCGSGCPLTTANLAQVRKALMDSGRDVTFLSISLDPEHDTPEVLRAYARAYGIGPGWHFLTGERADIERLRRKLGAYDLDPQIDADLRQHVGLVILGNEPVGRWITLPALSKPVRIRQAIERTILPPDQWLTGRAAIDDTLTERPLTAAPTDHIHPPELR